jgi:tetratricopeptide (TPR) repeat protein/predicted Ser/Thr protein kinase
LVPESSSADAQTLVPVSSSGAGQASAGGSSAADAWAAAGLQSGAILAGRYEILQALGEGGMGTVYKARDRELDRLVALKVIRPDLARNPAIIQRFKQELILARQVTHRNVVRIFDLGEADGVKFITMEFIEGKDLRSLLLEHKKFSPEEAAEIIRQVCLALDTAHTEGVIHRDLKPQNIMRDAQGRIVVMDFGLARSLESDGMTQTGALIGTMEYMSPEQGLGQELDQRSDLFTLGLIFYELLSGQVPYKADSALASLLKRTQERAVPVSSLDNQVPRVLSEIVSKCLERDAKLRYATARELLSDLEAWQGKGAAASIRLPAVTPWGQDIPWVLISVAAVILILAVTGFLLRDKLFGPSAKGPTGPVVSLAIVPFRNASGDASLNWMGPALSEMLRTDIGESAAMRTVPSDRVSQILQDLRIGPDATFDPDTLRRVAEFTSADHLLAGQFIKLGGQIRIDATLQDLKHQRNFSLKAEAAGEKDLPRSLQQLAESVQKDLALPAATIKELQANSLRPSSQSVQALRYYTEGLQLVRQGKNLEAVKRFQAAVSEDSNFALAYSKLAVTSAALGYIDKAQESSTKALALEDRVSPQEKYVIEAENARVSKDYAKAVDSYEKLAKVLPDDTDVQFTLARMYEEFGAFDKAGAAYHKLLAADPKNVDVLLHLGIVEIQNNNPQGSLEYLTRAQSLAIQLGNEEEEAAILDSLGNAYHYLNKLDEALRNYQQALDIKRRLGDKGGVAQTLTLMAETEQPAGKLEAALKDFQEALRLRRELGDKLNVARILQDLGNFYENIGKYDEALSVSKEALPIVREAGDRRNEAGCVNNIGWIYLDKGDYDNAMIYFQQALQLEEKVGSPGDTANTLYNIGETYARTGQYGHGVDYYLKALSLWRKAGDKSGVAYASYGLGTVFSYQGRYGAALNAEQDALNSWLETKDQGYWLPQIQASYGNALTLLGQPDKAQQNLDKAMGTARGLKNESLMARILNFQGDRQFYAGDYTSARRSFEQARQMAAHAKDREQILVSRTNLAKTAVKQGNYRQAMTELKAVAAEADKAGLKYLSVESSLYLGEALIATKDYPQARQEVEGDIRTSEQLGLQSLLARGHYLLGEALRRSGNASEASSHYAQAHRIIDDIRQEAHSDDVLKVGDLHKIYEESARWQHT